MHPNIESQVPQYRYLKMLLFVEFREKMMAGQTISYPRFVVVAHALREKVKFTDPFVLLNTPTEYRRKAPPQ